MKDEKSRMKGDKVLSKPLVRMLSLLTVHPSSFYLASFPNIAYCTRGNGT
jgi:hypothetical protein